MEIDFGFLVSLCAKVIEIMIYFRIIAEHLLLASSVLDVKD